MPQAGGVDASQRERDREHDRRLARQAGVVALIAALFGSAVGAVGTGLFGITAVQKQIDANAEDNEKAFSNTQEEDRNNFLRTERNDAYGRFYGDETILLRSEAALRTAMSTTKHPLPGTFEVQAGKLTDARKFFYQSSSNLLVISSTKLLCTTRALIGAHQNYDETLLAQASDLAHTGTFDSRTLHDLAKDVQFFSNLFLVSERMEAIPAIVPPVDASTVCKDFNAEYASHMSPDA